MTLHRPRRVPPPRPPRQPEPELPNVLAVRPWHWPNELVLDENGELAVREVER